MFENYTASFEIDTQRIELSLWDTSGELPANSGWDSAWFPAQISAVPAGSPWEGVGIAGGCSHLPAWREIFGGLLW